MKIKSLLLSAGILTTGYLMMGIDGCGGSKEMTSAKLYMQQKQMDKALSSLNAEIAKNPTNGEAYFYKGQVYYEMKEPVKMADAFREGLAVGMKPEQTANAKSLIKNQWGMVMNDGIKAMQEAADNPDKYAKAAEIFTKASKIWPDTSLTYYNMAIAQYNSKMYNESITSLDIYIAKGTPNQDVVNLAVNAYKNQNDFDGAIAYLNKFKSNPALDANWVYETIAQIYIDANRTDEALSAFMAAAEASPKNEVIRYNIGVLKLNKNETEESIKYFEEALSIRPDYPEASYNAGVAYLRLGKARQEAIEEAYSKEKNRKKKEEIAKDKSHLEFFQKALPYLESVKEGRQDDVTFWTVLGQVYTALGMNDKAKEAFDRFK